MLRSSRREYVVTLSFPAVRLFEHCRRFTLDCYSYVSIPLYFGVRTIFPKPMLMETSSTAIWNWNKFSVLIAYSVWVTNVVASGLGKSSPTPHITARMTYKTLYYLRHLPGE